MMKIEGKIIILSIVLITLLGFAVYGNSLGGKFILDDDVLVKNNTRIKSWSNLPGIFSEHIAAGGGRKWNSYRPLQIMTYMIDYSIWKLNVKGYHLTNILLHIAAALSVYWFIGILFSNRLISLLAVSFFIIHPVHTGAVTYISGRADPLAATFIILCLVLYVKNLHSFKLPLYLLSLLCCALALLSRENSIIIPALILLYHYTFRRKLRTAHFLPVLAVVLGYILMRTIILKTFLILKPPSTTLFQRIPGFFAALTGYLRLLFLPLRLRTEYGNGPFNFTHPSVITGILILSLLLICIFRMRKRNTLVFFSICWFLITLLPSSNLYPANAYMAEHWLYLPSLGMFLLWAKSLDSLFSARNLRAAAIIPTIGLLIFYSLLTVRQNSYWKDPVTLYEKTLEYAPESPRILNSLGLAYNGAGRTKEAIALFEKVKEIRPDYADVYNNLAIVYRSLGENEKAIALYRRAIEINPDYAGAHNNLGLAYNAAGRNKEAMESYRRAIEINPDSARAYNNLGLMFSAIGRNEEAIKLFGKAINIDPDYVEAYNSLGIAYGASGRKKEAIDLFRKVLEIDPDCAQAHNNLAVTYYSEKQYALAARHCDRAIELGYKVHPGFLNLLKRPR